MNDQVLQFAKMELNAYLNKVNSAFHIENINFQVNDSLEQFDLPQPEDPYLDDQYYIDIQLMEDVNPTIVGSIWATNARSILLAVYDYLYHLGYRFLRPGNEYEYIPKTIEMKRFAYIKRAVADHRHRGVCIEGADSLENIIDFVDWLPKVGFNSFFVQFQYPYAFLEKWYHHRYNPSIIEEPFDMKKVKEYSAIIDSEMAKRGLLHHRVGHGWTSETMGIPGIGWDAEEITLDEIKQKHLALVNGKREFFGGVPLNTNLCYSNIEVQEEMSDKIVQYAKEHPEVDYLHVWLADEYNNFCECANCCKELPTDQYIRLLNKVDIKLETEGLLTKIVFLLYQELLWAPYKEAFINPKRFVLMFAPISRTFETSYQEAGESVQLPKYNRNKIELPTNLEENLGSLKAWKNVFLADSFIYDYPLGRAHYGDPSYVAISKIISKDVKQLKSMGLNGYISCQELRSALPNALPNYVMGHTLFNENLLFEDIQEDYFQAAYSLGWEFVRDYLNRLGGYYSCDYFNGKGERVSIAFHQKMEQALNYLNESKSKLETYEIKSQGIHNIFWKHLLFHNRYCILLTNALKGLSQGNEEDTTYWWEQFRTYICDKENEYQKCFDVYRITEVSTRYTGFHL